MRYWLSFVGICLLFSPASAEIIYLNASDVYQENFDGLQNSGSGLTWSNNLTVPGWYSNHGQYTASDGSASTRALYSFGSVGSTERALGVVSLGSSADARLGVAIRNSTGAAINQFSVRFDGEQWRQSTTPVAAAQNLSFGYRTSSALGSLDGGVYTSVPSLAFTSPGTSLPGGAVDGNSPAFRTADITATVSGLNWQSGEYLWLRWEGTANGSGSQHGLAIDNFAFSAGTATAVPEPSSLALLSVASLATLIRRGRTR